MDSNCGVELVTLCRHWSKPKFPLSRYPIVWASHCFEYSHSQFPTGSLWL